VVDGPWEEDNPGRDLEPGGIDFDLFACSFNSRQSLYDQLLGTKTSPGALSRYALSAGFHPIHLAEGPFQVDARSARRTVVAAIKDAFAGKFSQPEIGCFSIVDHPDYFDREVFYKESAILVVEDLRIRPKLSGHGLDMPFVFGDNASCEVTAQEGASLFLIPVPFDNQGFYAAAVFPKEQLVGPEALEGGCSRLVQENQKFSPLQFLCLQTIWRACHSLGVSRDTCREILMRGIKLEEDRISVSINKNRYELRFEIHGEDQPDTLLPLFLTIRDRERIVSRSDPDQILLLSSPAE